MQREGQSTWDVNFSTMRKLLALLMLVLWTCGCGSKAAPPATPMTFATVDDEANNGKQVSLEGYPRLPRMGLVNDTIGLDVFEQPEGKGKKITVFARVGTGNNECEKPPKEYTQADLKLHTIDGTVIGADTKVRVSGQVLWSKTSTTDPKAHTFMLVSPIEITKL